MINNKLFSDSKLMDSSVLLWKLLLFEWRTKIDCIIQKRTTIWVKDDKVLAGKG